MVYVDNTRMVVRHAEWTDVIIFQGGKFKRDSTGCDGRFLIINEEGLLLLWNEWPPEILKCDGSIVRISSADPIFGAARGVMRGLRKQDEEQVSSRCCLVTYSRSRFSMICGLISHMMSQTFSDFHHVIVLIDYSRLQIEFINSMVRGDRRFILVEDLPVGQKMQFRGAMSIALDVDSEKYIKVDDDDVYSASFVETLLARAGNADLFGSCSQLYFDSRINRTQWVKRGNLFGNCMCFSRRAILFLVRCDDVEDYLFEDEQAHKLLAAAGYEIVISTEGYPHVVYVKHGNNVSGCNT